MCSRRVLKKFGVLQVQRKCSSRGGFHSFKNVWIMKGVKWSYIFLAINFQAELTWTNSWYAVAQEIRNEDRQRLQVKFNGMAIILKFLYSILPLFRKNSFVAHFYWKYDSISLE